MDDEDRERYNSGLRKKRQRLDRKAWEADMEELAPKATGRDAVVEKRRATSAFHREQSNRDADVDVTDSFLMGSDQNDFAKR